MKGGPVRSDVVARVTADAVNGEILYSELARDTHTPLEGGPRDIQTILVFEESKVKYRRHRFSKTLLGEGECVDVENTTAETPVTSDPKHSVNGPCWNLNVRCQLLESLSPCCCHDVPRAQQLVYQ